MKTKIVYSEKCLSYGTWHIEGPQRVKIASEILKAKGYEFVEPTPASEDALLTVHDAEYLWNLKKGTVEDPDTPAYENIYEFAKLSAGGALLASKINGFSLMRPPGHHAGRNGAALGVYTRGFCYANNMAIAVKKLGKRMLILDIDGHHGNGTQEIFQGEETLDKALGALDLSKFEAMGVSCGFDTHLGDLATLGLIEQDYFNIGKRIASLGKPAFFVLEGGYVGENVGMDIDNLLMGYEEKR